MLAAPLVDSPSGALTPEVRRELTLAKTRARPILKAARVATFNGWTLGVIAAASTLFTLVSYSTIGALVTAALAVVASIEFRGRARLLAFDPSGATQLGWNQIGLLVLVTAYCAWMLWSSATGVGPLEAELKANPELGEALGDLGEIDALIRQIVVATYAIVIVLTLVVQGLNALYYFTRRKHVLAYIQETPAWALEAQRLSAAS